MQIPNIPPELLPILPLVGAIISGLVGQKTLPAWLNGLILLATLVGVSFACLVVTGNLSNNPTTDIIILSGFIAALIAGPFKFIEAWLQEATPSIIGLGLLFKQDAIRVEQAAVTILKPRASAVNSAYIPPKPAPVSTDDALLG